MDKKGAPAPPAGTRSETNPVGPIIPQQEAFERAYIERFGLAIFPVKSRDKIPMTPNGFKDATRDWATYESLHRGRPHNVAMPTGPVNGFFVLDIDPRHGGDETLKHLVEQYGSLPPTWQAATQSGGVHYFFRWDDRYPAVTNRANVLPGIDIRGDGGYVLVAPSRVEGTYRWIRSPAKFELAPAPDWLWTLLDAPSRAKRSVDFSHYAAGIYAGERNESFARIAGTLLGRNIDIQLAWALIRAYNQVYCNPPLDESELLKTFESIANRELAKRARRTRGRTA
ncbi:bifunctional DNA primase/polymerase [Alicyclobacillus kakegawensis]|uniref:bifunctional DNA primase/polymerase n=1 Tax=Alicyclobacillus kakegawensis TaxID=392012 RepID=UPI00082F709B|nr:bifunctional DNA primase/polymerase [Alicyclobacillus kakegawensis]